MDTSLQAAAAIKILLKYRIVEHFTCTTLIQHGAVRLVIVQVDGSFLTIFKVNM